MKASYLLVLTFFLGARLTAQINFTQGLVAYYPFSGNSQDASGNNNHATNFGATLTQDQFGNTNSAYFFNGTSNYMTVAPSNSLQLSSITMVAKIKPNGFYPGLCYNNSIFDRGNGGYNAGSFSLIYSPTLNQNPATYCVTPDSMHENYRINVNTSATNSLACITPLNANPYISTGQWDCVIGVYDSATNTGSIYVNGVFRYSYFYPIGIGGTNNSILYIGGTTNPTYPYYVNGILDELRIYNRVLNTQELDSICNLGNAPNSVIADFNHTYPNICDASMIQFFDASAAINSNLTSWSWNFGDGNTSNLQNPTHNYSLSGVYNVTLIVGNNFNNFDTIQYQIIATNPSLLISGYASPDSICLGEATALYGLGGLTYTWSGGVSNGIPFQPAATTTYTVTGTSNNGCTSSSTVSVVVNQLPTIVGTAFPPATCPGGTVVLTGTGGLSYSWSGGVIDGVAFSPVATSIYTVTGTDIYGCTSVSSVQVIVSENLPISVSPSSVKICKGDSVILSANGAVNYSWSVVPGLNIYSGSSVIATPMSSSTYTVTGTDLMGCSGTAVALVEVIDQLKIAVTKSRDAECDVNVVQLHVTGGENYVWTPSGTLSNPYGSTTNANISETTTFYVSSAIGSCTDSDSITVYFYKNNSEEIFIPTAFSPNDDGLNDCFRIRHSANFSNYYFAIYNRWGQKIYETDDPTDCWNGKYNGEEMPLGTYYYFLKAQTICGSIFRKGDISIIH